MDPRQHGKHEISNFTFEFSCFPPAGKNLSLEPDTDERKD